MRLALVQLTEEAFQFIWSLHHLLLDGWSRPILLQEVFQTYNAFCAGREPHLRVSRPYGDYVAWLQKQDLSQAEQFWRQELKGFTTPTVLNVGQGHGGSSSKKESYAEEWMQLSAVETSALQGLAEQHHLSVNTFVQGHVLSC
jgi:surfactin family lipopeptide synthetase C